MRIIAFGLLCAFCSLAAQQFDVTVVGAGAASLSAAWEEGRRGKHVAVLNMFSVSGGTPSSQKVNGD